MPLYVADYLADTGHLGAAEHGAYLLLIMHYWANGGLPDDDRKLARIARMDASEWADARETIGEFFSDGWRHERIEKHLAEANAAYERRAEAGRKGGLSKAKAESEHCSSNASALPKQSEPEPDISSSLRSEDKPRAQRASVAKEAAAAFERFWTAWPNKVAKRDAAKAFLKVAGEIDAILDGIGRYMAAKPPDRAWMHPATFLNGRRWEDAPAPTPMARAGPSFRDNRNGVGNLLAEAYGLNGNHEENHSPAFRALPLAGDGQREPNRGDGGGVSGNATELLIAGSLRRM